MATDRQKEAARRNIAKARDAQSARAHGKDIPRQDEGMSTAEKDELADQEFAFPKERKEPLTDARHVRNAIARFDQVEGVSDRERDQDADQKLGGEADARAHAQRIGHLRPPPQQIGAEQTREDRDLPGVVDQSFDQSHAPSRGDAVRRGEVPAVAGRIEKGALLLDLRSVAPEDDDRLTAAILTAVGSHA